MFTRNHLKQLVNEYEAQIIIAYGYDQKVAQPEIIVRLRKLRKAQRFEMDHRSKRQQDCLPSVLEAIFAPLFDNLKNQSLEKPSDKQLMGWFCKIYEECDVSEDPYKQLDLRLEGETLNAPTKTHIREMITLFHINAKILRLVFAPLFKEVQTTLNQTEQEAKTDLTSAQAPEDSSYLSSAPEVPAEAAFIEPKIIYFQVRQIQWFLANYILEKRSALQATGLNEEDKAFGEALRFYLEGVLFQAASKVMKQVRDEIKKEAQTPEAIDEHYAQIEGLYLFLEELFNLPVVIDDSTLLILMQEFLAMVEFSKKNPVKLAGFDTDSHLRALTEATKKTFEFKNQRSQMFGALSSDAFSSIQKSTNALLKILLMDPEAMHALESFIEAVKRASLDLKKKLPIISAPREVRPSPEPSTAQTPLLPPRSPQQVPSSVTRTGSQTDRRVITATSMGRVASSVRAALSCCCRFFPRSAAEAAQRLPNRESKAVTAGYGGLDDTPMRREPGPS